MVASIKEVKAKLPKKVVRRVTTNPKKILKEMKLSEVRKTRGITQEDLAKKLAVKQSSLSRFENRKNIRLTTLKEHVKALGGKLEIQVAFKDFIIPLYIK